MRDLKFRCWDADAECFSHSIGEPSNPSQDGEYYWGFEKGVLKCYVCCTETPSDPMEAPYPSSKELESHVEQYTGYTDSDLQDLYEGDKGLVCLDADDLECVCKYEQEFAAFMWVSCVDPEDRYWFRDVEARIIGNIHEDKK